MCVLKENLIGELNRGWIYVKYFLEFECGNVYGLSFKCSIVKVKLIVENEFVGIGECFIDDLFFVGKIVDMEC